MRKYKPRYLIWISSLQRLTDEVGSLRMRPRTLVQALRTQTPSLTRPRLCPRQYCALSSRYALWWTSIFRHRLMCWPHRHVPLTLRPITTCPWCCTRLCWAGLATRWCMSVRIYGPIFTWRLIRELLARRAPFVVWLGPEQCSFGGVHTRYACTPATVDKLVQ